MMTNTCARLLACTALVAIATSAEPAPRRPLPSFAGLAADGAEVASDVLVADGAWLLVYVRQRCAPCDRVLAVAGGDERPAASRIVFIVGGADPDAVREIAGRYPSLAAARWLADPDGAAAAALGVEAMPVVHGLRGSMIEWTMVGGLPDRAVLESALFTWLERREP